MTQNASSSPNGNLSVSQLQDLQQTEPAGRDIYVVYSRKHNSVLHDPMTMQPLWRVSPEMLGEVAVKFKGIIVTRKRAIELILKHTHKS